MTDFDRESSQQKEFYPEDALPILLPFSINALPKDGQAKAAIAPLYAYNK